LALALAESLTELSAESRATDALESLFLDERFGTLGPSRSVGTTATVRTVKPSRVAAGEPYINNAPT
jgi:hypothetical protein